MTHLLLIVIYLSFISLGLPDALLGSAWPTIYPEFDVPVSYAGIVSVIISAGTVVSSLMSDRLTHWLGAAKVTAFSVAITAAALLGFSVSDSFWMLCVLAIPYGLGAGSVDASLNNYVALHYASRHMSWLHCMWGIGATAGPYIMGHVLAGGQHWHLGYRSIGILQIALTAILFFSLPLWKGRPKAPFSKAADSGNDSGNDFGNDSGNNSANDSGNDSANDSGNDSGDQPVNTKPAMEDKPLPLLQIIRIPGAKEVMVTFFCYCGLELTVGLWASSYLALYKGIPSETAAFYASLFYLGITVGRAFSGFLTIKLSDTQMIRLGLSITAAGIAALFLPLGNIVSLTGLIVIGLGCAPIYPCVIHSTPAHFGADKSQALIGVQMASAYVGNCLMPPLFGLIANHITVALLPVYLLIILALMAVMHEKLVQKCEK